MRRRGRPASPRRARLLERHLAFAHQVTPEGHVHALDVDRLVDPSVTFFSARVDDALVGVGALRELDPTHGEIKSMHTVAAARRSGVASPCSTTSSPPPARGYERVSLETGTYDAFAAALYAARVHRLRAVRGLHRQPAQRLHDAGPGVISGRG